MVSEKSVQDLVESLDVPDLLDSHSLWILAIRTLPHLQRWIVHIPANPSQVKRADIITNEIHHPTTGFRKAEVNPPHERRIGIVGRLQPFFVLELLIVGYGYPLGLESEAHPHPPRPNGFAERSELARKFLAVHPPVAHLPEICFEPSASGVDTEILHPERRDFIYHLQRHLLVDQIAKGEPVIPRYGG